MRTRTAVVLIGTATLLLAVPFAWSSWAFGGPSGLLAFVVPFVGLIAVGAAGAALTRRTWQDDPAQDGTRPPRSSGGREQL